VRRPILISIAVLALVVGGLGAAVAVFSSKADGKIAAGVKIGDTDVGGLTPAAARTKVQAQLLKPLAGPITVDLDGKTWKLTAQRAKIQANIDAMVADAMARSEQGNVLQHAWRQATGGKVDATIPAAVTYSRLAVNRFVDRIAKEIAVEPRDATLKYSDTTLTGSESREGVSLNGDRLKRRIKRAIATQGATRSFTPSTAVVKPKVSTADLAEQYPVVLTVDRDNFKLRLFKGLKLDKTYDVRVGQQGLETPAGLYHIQNKAIDPAWNVPYSAWTGDLAGTVVPGGTPENPLKARWMGIFDGAGIHGISESEYSTIGTAASHGCVGMRIDDVIDLYPRVPVGAPIYID
jgi:lipoprotein-anchoring transpeptidase ErfK/SrfK